MKQHTNTKTEHKYVYRQKGKYILNKLHRHHWRQEGSHSGRNTSLLAACDAFLFCSPNVIQKMLPLPLPSWNLWNITHSLQFSAPTVVLAEPPCCSQKLQGLWYTGDEGRLGQHGELQENRNALEWEGSKGELPFPAYRKVSINLPKFPPLYVVENEVWH